MQRAHQRYISPPAVIVILFDGEKKIQTVYIERNWARIRFSIAIK